MHATHKQYDQKLSQFATQLAQHRLVRYLREIIRVVNLRIGLSVTNVVVCVDNFCTCRKDRVRKTEWTALPDTLRNDGIILNHGAFMQVVQRIRFLRRIPLCLGTMIEDDNVRNIRHGTGWVKIFAPIAVGTLCIRIEKCEKYYVSDFDCTTVNKDEDST